MWTLHFCVSGCELGMDAMKRMPPVLFLTVEDDDEEDASVNVSQLQMKMLFEGRGNCMCV